MSYHQHILSFQTELCSVHASAAQCVIIRIIVRMN